MSTIPSLRSLRARPHWSFSRINALVNFCSLSWAFRYIHRLEQGTTPSSLVFGTAFHNALSFHATRRMNGRDCTSADCAELFAELFEKSCRTGVPPVRFGEKESVDTLIALGRRMLDIHLGSLDPEEAVEAVGEAFSVPLVDASGIALEKPLIGEYDLVTRRGGVRTIVDWKTSARRWPRGKAETDLQPTCYLWAEHQRGTAATRFRFDVVTKTKSPVCERLPATRTPKDFVRLGELVRVLERVVANECFLPREGGWECANCPYTDACKSWHRERTRTFVHIEDQQAA